MPTKSLLPGSLRHGLIALSAGVGKTSSVAWHTTDGGGGACMDGVCVISGTAGLPDAGTINGGRYTLAGGFWALPVAVQESKAPALSITPAAPGFATISWDPPTPGFPLQPSPAVLPPIPRRLH